MHIYFAFTELYVKIGRTKNPRKRVSDLMSGCPEDLTIIVIKENEVINENVLHKRFKEHRLHHEWFTYHQEIKDFIDTLVYLDKATVEKSNYKLITVESSDNYVNEILKRGSQKREGEVSNDGIIRIIKTSRIQETEVYEKKFTKLIKNRKFKQFLA